MPPVLNTTLDDICAVIGFTPTRMLQAWYGGRYVRLPVRMVADHPLVHLIGRKAYERLWKAFRHEGGDERLWIPSDDEAQRYDRDVKFARMLADGCEVEEAARRFGIGLRAAQALRRDLVRDGWLRWDMEGHRYRLRTGRKRAVFLGTGEVSDEPPPPARSP